MNVKSSILGALVVLSAASVAHAQVGVSASLGTTGAGLHVSVPITQQLNARFGINGLSFSRDESTSDVDYDFKLKMRTVDALLDYFPMNGGLRLTSGVVYNGNEIDANAKPNANGTYTLNGRSYSATQVGALNGQIDFRKLAPYVGIGWGNAVAKETGWGFAADLGVLFQGSPKTSLTNTGCTASAAVCTQIASDVAAENRALQDEAQDFKAYPVLRVGVSYKF